MVNAESSRGDGKRATVSGRGEYLKCSTSSTGTVERTSVSRESHLESTRLPRAVQHWLARNSKALDPERINRSKSARTSSGRCSWKPPHVDSHQSSHDETSQTPESMVSIEETCEADKETERFLASLAFSRVMEVTPGGLNKVLEKRKRRYDSTFNDGDRAQAETRARSSPPKIWTAPN